MSDLTPPAKKKSFRWPDFDTLNFRRFLFIGTVIVVIAICLLKVKPNLDNTKKDTESAKTTTTQVTKLRNDYDVLKKSQTGEGGNTTRALLQALPETVDFQNEYDRLGVLADKVGAELTSVETQDPASQGQYQKQNVTLNVAGSYEACLRFLGGMHNMVRPKGADSLEVHGPIWVVDSIGLTPGSEGDTNLALTAGIYLGTNSSAASSTATPTPTTAPAP